MQKGSVFNIQKFCINDGPGIRTTVFLKGCPLRCAWCHNPESHKIAPELLYDADKCLHCGKCIATCPKGAHRFEGGEHVLYRSLCVACGACTSGCMANALEIAGSKKSVEDILTEVLKDKVFYENSGGGMTLSGGEPMMQFEFSYALMEAAHNQGIHTCIETCGFADTEEILKMARVTDLFLFDWKLTDPDLHKHYTGVDNQTIKQNLLALDEAGAKTVLRCPIIPAINDNESHFDGIAELANQLQNILRIEIEPYHSLGESKYPRTGKESPLQRTEMPKPDVVEGWIQAIQKKTAVPVKKG